ALTALKNRDVVVWPDSDDAGRLLMRYLTRELDGVAKSVRCIAPDVPPTGDAHDYFANGGSVDTLLDMLAKVRTEPWVEETADGYVVSLPEDGGFIRFEASDIDSTRRRSLDIMLTVRCELPGTTKDQFSGRLNVTSLSNRESFRRQLDEMFGKEGGWTRRLNIACSMVRKAHNERDNSIVLLEAPEVTTQHLLAPYMLTDGPTIIFGQGGSAKTYLALAWSACIALGMPFLGSPVQQAAVLFIDYESTPGVMKKRLEKVLAGMGMANSLPPIFYWPATAPLVDMVPALQHEILKDDIGMVVVDSVMLAAGADAERAETAGRYFGALRRLGVPSLNVGHVTKAGGDQFPFGSIFWHNSARLTWNVKLRHEEDDTVHLGLFNREANDGPQEHPQGLRISFDGLDGPVTIAREGLDAEWDKELSNPERIRGELRAGKCSVKELAEALELSEAIIRTTLNRMTDAQKFGSKAPDGSHYWVLTARDAEEAAS
ncbi:MAG: AAA family ATPase, partial [Chloroflexi bacterium]|nr:AAA family ATPase [Chloroflexota bacterium]